MTEMQIVRELARRKAAGEHPGNITELALMLGKSRAWISNLVHGHFEGWATRRKIEKLLKGETDGKEVA